jgi:hypothetical protein
MGKFLRISLLLAGGMLTVSPLVFGQPSAWANQPIMNPNAAVQQFTTPPPHPGNPSSVNDRTTPGGASYVPIQPDPAPAPAEPATQVTPQDPGQTSGVGQEGNRKNEDVP